MNQAFVFGVLIIIIGVFLNGGVVLGTTTQYDNPLSAENIPELVGQIVEYFSRILVYYLVPLLIIIGAYVIVTSGGSASKVNRGKKIIIWTLAGFVLILLANGLIALVQKLLGG